ncbi:MFS transporter [Rhodovulum sp. DZ06]|uniref:MFS transporter n=1 Tax=Rhodovulum sp. DZ06 TaxID=3425126 RepID=UPI003D341D20
MTTPASPPRLFYGWIVVAVAFATMGVAITARTGLSLLYPELIDEFGWSSGAAAGAIGAGFFVSTAILPAVGWMMDRYGPRLTLPVGACLVAAGYVLLTTADSLPALYVAVGGFAVTGSMAMSYIAHSMFLPNWFVRRRGLAVGLAFSGVGVAGIGLLPLMQWGIDTYGWRDAALAMAALIVAVIVPINAIFQRRSPQEMGLQPDGDPAPLPGAAPADDLVVDRAWAETEWTLRLAMRTTRFWCASGGFFLGLFIWYGIQMHQTRFLVDAGLAPERAATALGLVAFCGIFGQIGVGALSDRIGREPCWGIAGAGFAIASAAFLGFAETGDERLVWLAVAAQGLMGYGLASIFGAVATELFAGPRLASIFAAISVFGNFGGGAGAWAMGALHDLTGDYRAGFALCIVASIGSAVLIWAAGPGKVRRVAGRRRA